MGAIIATISAKRGRGRVGLLMGRATQPRVSQK